MPKFRPINSGMRLTMIFRRLQGCMVKGCPICQQKRKPPNREIEGASRGSLIFFTRASALSAV